MDVIGAERPIFVELADRIADDILGGLLEEDTQVPSTNELAAFHRINPATAAKGLNLLVDAGVLHKQRGIGMFVSTGAREALRARRREDFAATYLSPVLAEAQRLGLSRETLAQLVLSTPASPTDPAAPGTAGPGTAQSTSTLNNPTQSKEQS